VAVVGGVTVPVVQVVGVILVWHGNVTALRPVVMLVIFMGRMLRVPAFVHVVTVDAVDMAVVRVIGVIAVREAEVAAALTVGVRVIGVRGVLNGNRHAGNPSCGAAPAKLAG
jgi:hypothetical protein